MRHRPQPRAALSAAGYADPNLKQRRSGPDFSRQGDVLYPESDEGQEFIDGSGEQELDLSGGIVASEEIIEQIRHAGLTIGEDE